MSSGIGAFAWSALNALPITAGISAGAYLRPNPAIWSRFAKVTFLSTVLSVAAQAALSPLSNRFVFLRSDVAKAVTAIISTVVVVYLTAAFTAARKAS